MTAVADPTLYWAVLARPRGEILVAEAQSPGLHLGLLGIPSGFTEREAESWLYDIIGVAHEASPAPDTAKHIPGLLRHALTGLVFSHAELWDRGGAAAPCSFAFVHTVHEVGFGLVGEARVALWVDGQPVEPEWVAVRDELGREARAWSISSDRSVQVRVEWDRPGPGDDGAEVEAVWSAARGPAVAARPALALVQEEPIAAGESDPAMTATSPADPTDAGIAATGAPAPSGWSDRGRDDPSGAAAAETEEERSSAIARWLHRGFSWFGGRKGEREAAEQTASDPTPGERIELFPAAALREDPRVEAAAPPPAPELVHAASHEPEPRDAAPPDVPAPTIAPREPEGVAEAASVATLPEPIAPPSSWRSIPERIPPTPEPPALTARTVAWTAPPDPHALELPPPPAPARANATEVPRAGDAADIEFHTVAVEPPRAAERHAPAEPPAAMPAEPIVSRPAPALPAASITPPARPEPLASPKPVPVKRAASVPPAPAASGKAQARRLVFQTTERPAWPTMRQLTRTDLPLWRRPWMWGLAILLLFAGGWLLGASQENSGPRDVSRRGAVGTVLNAIGLGGPRFQVDVTSRPSGAWIAVDGQSLALRTPAALELAPGEHEMTLSFEDLGAAIYRVRGLKGDRVPLDATLWGALEVFSPDELGLISVTVDGVERGVAPLRVDSLSPGVHELRFAGPGVVTWGQTVDIRVGETREVLARAVGSPATGVLQIQSSLTDEQGSQPLKGAQVWIDGELRGVTPLTLDLSRGPHSVRVAHKGQEAPIQVIDLPGGNQRFAVFEFGVEVDAPRVVVDLPPRLPRDRATVISASLQGATVPEAREMWLHTQMPGGPWRRYPMTLLKSPSGLVGVTLFPRAVFDPQGRARFYVSAQHGQGDESFTEIRAAQLEKAPAR